MSAELVGFLSAFGAMVLTIIGVWFKKEIPVWFRNKQNQDNKKLDAELDIKRNSVTEEFKKDGALYSAYLDSVKSMSSLIEVCKNLAANVDKGFNTLAATAVSNQNFLSMMIETAKEDVKQYFKAQMEQYHGSLLNEIKDQKIKELTEKVERIEKAPESKVVV